MIRRGLVDSNKTVHRNSSVPWFCFVIYGVRCSCGMKPIYLININVLNPAPFKFTPSRRSRLTRRSCDIIHHTSEKFRDEFSYFLIHFCTLKPKKRKEFKSSPRVYDWKESTYRNWIVKLHLYRTCKIEYNFEKV